ncbi:hypothetical protein [Streptomyces zagrosensis]|uniref:MFS transporter n=1 Tax=Streptomyces zagrosensis TaxID=1042984 RepID=A0A7W9Q8F0_9ACTN|nr:hypothetical protein [Streptomyces zagrosensis]
MRRATHAQGAGESGLGKLIELHAVNSAGDMMITVALASTVFFSVPTDEARGRVALYLAITMAPFALLAPVIGPLLDRIPHGRRAAMASAMLTRALLALTMADAVSGGGLELYPAALGVLVASKAYGVVRSAVVPRLLPLRFSLVKANSRVTLGGLLATGLAAPIGAGLHQIGPAWPLYGACAVFTTGTILCFTLPHKVDSAKGEATAHLLPRPPHLLPHGHEPAHLSGASHDSDSPHVSGDSRDSDGSGGSASSAGPSRSTSSDDSDGVAAADSERSPHRTASAALPRGAVAKVAARHSSVSALVPVPVPGPGREHEPSAGRDAGTDLTTAPDATPSPGAPSPAGEAERTAKEATEAEGAAGEDAADAYDRPGPALVEPGDTGSGDAGTGDAASAHAGSDDAESVPVPAEVSLSEVSLTKGSLIEGSASKSGLSAGPSTGQEIAVRGGGSSSNSNSNSGSTSTSGTGNGGGAQGRRPGLRTVGSSVLHALPANATLRMLSGFLTLFLAFMLREHPLGGLSPELSLGIVAVSAGAGNACGTAIGAGLRTRGPELIIAAVLTTALGTAITAAVLFSQVAVAALAAIAGLSQALGKLSLDALIQRDVPENVRTSAFARSETALQMSWVAGGAIGILLPLNGVIGMAAAGCFLTLGWLGTVPGLLASARRGTPHPRVA